MARRPASGSTRNLFTTLVYEASLSGETGSDAFNAELEDACRSLAREDGAGRAWCKANGYGGYTSYASLDDLPRRMTVFDALRKKLDRHVAAFADQLAFDLGGRKLKLDSLWVNVLKPGRAHSGHVHPHSAISGTVYVVTPPAPGACAWRIRASPP